MINTFFQKKANVTRIPTPQNFAHYVDNSIYEMKQHLNTSRLIINALIISQVVSWVIIGGLFNFCVQTGTQIEEYKILKQKPFKSGNIELAPIEIIGGKNVK